MPFHLEKILKSTGIGWWEYLYNNVNVVNVIEPSTLNGLNGKCCLIDLIIMQNMNEVLVCVTICMNIENILREISYTEKGYLGHTHLVSFIFIKVVKMRKSLKNTSRKEKWFRMEKDIFILWGRWWMWKWAYELDSKVKTMISHLGVMQVLPGRLSLIKVKHSESCHLNWHRW